LLLVLTLPSSNLSSLQSAGTHALHIDTSAGSESASSSSSAQPDASPSPSPSPLPAASSPNAGDDDVELVKIHAAQQQQQHDAQLSLQSPDGFNVNGGFDFQVCGSRQRVMSELAFYLCFYC
jgi:hypothetical protein